MRCLLVCTTASKLYSIRSRTTGPHAWQSLFWSSLECWSLGSKTRCESAEVSKVAVEDLCCLLFVFPTSALLKREENVALGTAAQLRWTAARTRLPHEARLRSETYPRILLASMSQTYFFCMSDVVCLETFTKEPSVEGDKKTVRNSTRKRDFRMKQD